VGFRRDDSYELPTEADAGGELLGQVDQADGLGAVLGPELDRPER
jgi:hypothetical protein